MAASTGVNGTLRLRNSHGTTIDVPAEDVFVNVTDRLEPADQGERKYVFIPPQREIEVKADIDMRYLYELLSAVYWKRKPDQKKMRLWLAKKATEDERVWADALEEAGLEEAAFALRRDFN